MSTDIAPRLELFRNSSFRRLWGAQFCAMTALYALNFAAIVAVSEQAPSVTRTGMVILSSILPAFLGSLVAGIVVDWGDRVRVLIGSHLMRMLPALVFWLLVQALSNPLGSLPIYILLGIGAIFTQFATSAELAMLPQLVRSEHLIPANSILQISVLVAEGLGVVVIGPLVSKVAGAGSVGLIGALLNGVALMLVLPLPAMRVRTARGSERPNWIVLGEDLRAGWAAIVRDRVLRLVTVQMALISVLLLMLLSMVPALATFHLGLEVTDVAWLMIPGGLGFGLGALLVSLLGDRFSHLRWISGGLMAIGCAIIFMVAFSNGEGISRLFLVGAIVGLGMALAFSLISARTVIQERPEPAMRGRVIAAQLVLANALAILPILLGGMIADQLGVRPCMVMLALVALGSGAAGWRQIGP